jgi:hypothetical protein
MKENMGMRVLNAYKFKIGRTQATDLIENKGMDFKTIKM